MWNYLPFNMHYFLKMVAHFELWEILNQFVVFLPAYMPYIFSGLFIMQTLHREVPEHKFVSFTILDRKVTTNIKGCHLLQINLLCV